MNLDITSRQLVARKVFESKRMIASNFVSGIYYTAVESKLEWR